MREKRGSRQMHLAAKTSISSIALHGRRLSEDENLEGSLMNFCDEGT